MGNPFDLSGKVALVTGASQGLGEHFSRCLAGAGAKLVLAARSRANLERVQKSIEASGGEALSLELDVRDAASIAQAFAAIDAAFGRIDVLVNNAGIAVTKAALDLSSDEWDNVVDTNLRGAFLMAQAAAKRMMAQKAGAIVNISSIYGVGVAGHIVPYAAAKAGMIQMTKALALELARHGIRVNALAPGYVETDMTREHLASEAGQKLLRKVPMRRFGAPEDLDGPLLLLASDAGRYVTGATIVADGGFLLS
jgi:NAD(P)-dependent dehydrogenase (short-subunit alcohol dehydrogenase family)